MVLITHTLVHMANRIPKHQAQLRIQQLIQIITQQA
jgi:hypothetical protein